MKLVILGCGHAGALKNFNNCFLIENNNKVLLVDAGGGNRILDSINKSPIALNDIEHAFISHNHADHLLGFAWLLRYTLVGYKTTPLTIYGSEECLEAIKQITIITMGEKIWNNNFNKKVFFVPVKHGSKQKIAGLTFEFFDTLATDMHQIGFFISSKKFLFAGDVPLNESYFEKFKNFNFVCLEGFCSEREKKGKELPLKKHYTIIQAAEVANKINAKNLIVWHTDDGLGKKRKTIYTNEIKQHFNGNCFVPNDLETIDIK